MKAKSLFKAYVWAEVLFMGYLLMRKEPVLSDDEKQKLTDLENQLMEKTNGPQDP